MKDRWRDEDRHYLSMPGLGECPTGFIALFVESSGQYWQFAKKGKGAVDGTGGTGKGQAKKVPKKTRIHKINETCTPTENYPIFLNLFATTRQMRLLDY